MQEHNKKRSDQRDIFSRRSFMIGAAAAATSGLAIDATFIDPQHTEATYLDIHLDRLPQAFDGFKIAQLSDIHYGFTMGDEYLDKAIRICNSFAPDVNVLTGDFVTAPGSGKNGAAVAAHDAGPCAKKLEALRSHDGNVAVLGNHDVETDPAIVRQKLESGGMRVLMNERMSIERAGERLWIAGVDDVLHHRQDLARTMLGIPPDEAVVLLAHEPDFADHVARAKQKIDLQLSGHSHGGQVRFPFIGAPYLPNLAKKYPLGWYAIGDLQLYTNRGLGTIGLPVRFLCPPEVTLITLRKRISRSL